MPGHGVWKSAQFVETLYSMMFSLIGIVIVASYLAMVASVLTNKLERKSSVEQQLLVMIDFMKSHRFSASTQHRVLEHHRVTWKLSNGNEHVGNFDDLPFCFNAEIASLSCGDYLKNVIKAHFHR
jgi:type II secretory pathway pseudopilin PulG